MTDMRDFIYFFRDTLLSFFPCHFSLASPLPFPSFYASLFSSFLPSFFMSLVFHLLVLAVITLLLSSVLQLTPPSNNSFLSSILVSPYSSISLHCSHIFLERIIMFSRLHVTICSYTLIWACVQTCTQPAKCYVGKKNHATMSYFCLS